MEYVLINIIHNKLIMSGRITTNNNEHTLGYSKRYYSDRVTKIMDNADNSDKGYDIDNISCDDFMMFYKLVKYATKSKVDILTKSNNLREMIGENMEKVIKYYNIARSLHFFCVLHVTTGIIQKNIDRLDRDNVHIFSLLASNNEEYNSIVWKYISENYSTTDLADIYVIRNNINRHIIEKFCKKIEDIGINKRRQLVYRTGKNIHFITKSSNSKYTHVVYDWGEINDNLAIDDYIIKYSYRKQIMVELVFNNDLATYHIRSSSTDDMYGDISYNGKINIDNTSIDISKLGDNNRYITIKFDKRHILRLIDDGYRLGQLLPKKLPKKYDFNL